MRSKKGQVGESITWIVTTVILIILLIIFIYASIVISKNKSIKSNSEADSEELDWIKTKTEMAYSIDSDNKDKIQFWILKEKKNE